MRVLNTLQIRVHDAHRPRNTINPKHTSHGRVQDYCNIYYYDDVVAEQHLLSQVSVCAGMAVGVRAKGTGLGPNSAAVKKPLLKRERFMA